MRYQCFEGFSFISRMLIKLARICGPILDSRGEVLIRNKHFQMGPQVGVSFGIFSYLQPLLLDYLNDCSGDSCNKSTSYNRYSARHLLIASSLAGSVSGLVGKTITYPLDLAKRRLQVGASIIS